MAKLLVEDSATVAGNNSSSSGSNGSNDSTTATPPIRVSEDWEKEMTEAADGIVELERRCEFLSESERNSI